MRARVGAGFSSIVSRCDERGADVIVLVTHAAPAILLAGLIGGREALNVPLETAGMRNFERTAKTYGDRSPFGTWRFVEAPKCVIPINLEPP